MKEYNTPNVYIEEQSILPPSVVGLSTAVPAFIGYTEKMSLSKTNQEELYKPIRITNMKEYEAIFGKADLESFESAEDTLGNITVIRSGNTPNNQLPKYLLYYQIQMYFANGGNVCYIVSIGKYEKDKQKDKDAFTKGIDALEKEDEPTLIMLSDAIDLGEDYYTLCTYALDHCANKGGTKFTILDVRLDEDSISKFREKINSSALKYGAAYYPYLETNLTYHYDENNISLQWYETVINNSIKITHPNCLHNCDKDDSANYVVTFQIEDNNEEDKNSISTFADDKTNPEIIDTTKDDSSVETESKNSKIIFDLVTGLTVKFPKGAKAKEIVDQWNDNIKNKSNTLFAMEVIDENNNIVEEVKDQKLELKSQNLPQVQYKDTAKHYKILEAIKKQRVILPPSGAIAGIYSRVDRERGVWKAPANISINSVIQPNIKITDADQNTLNVDPTSGKSINAIRSFTEMGTVVWGSKTLDGNNPEWRYIPVRRLFNTIEASLKKATMFAVFEPNYEMTWLKVKVMVDNYLNGLWKRGALAGSKPEDAYSVNIGLGKTMTAQDILEGLMIVEIGIAAVRPAEFIILRFAHILQRS